MKRLAFIATTLSSLSFAGIEGGTPLKSPVTDKETRINSRTVSIDENNFTCIFPKNGELPTWKLSFDSDPYNFYYYDGKEWKLGINEGLAATIKKEVESIDKNNPDVKKAIKREIEWAKERATHRVNRNPDLSNPGAQHAVSEVVNGELAFEERQEIEKRAIEDVRRSKRYQLIYPLEQAVFTNYERNTDPNAQQNDVQLGTAEGTAFGIMSADPFDLNKTETCPRLTFTNLERSKKLTFDMIRRESANSMKASYYESASSERAFSSFETKPWLTGTRGMAIIKGVGGEPSSDTAIDLSRPGAKK